MEYIIIALTEGEDGQRTICSSGRTLGQYYGKTFETRDEAEAIAESLRQDHAEAGEQQGLIIRVVTAEPTHTRALANPMRRQRQREPRPPGRPLSELGPFNSRRPSPPEDRDKPASED